MPRSRPIPSDLGNQRDSRGRPYKELLSTALNPGAGITAGSGTIYKSSVKRDGGLIITRIDIDLTGLTSPAAGDILGTAGVCHIGYIDPAVCGTILGGTMYCAEAPTGGEPDIDLYSATVGTGAYDAAITSLVETAVTNAGTLSLGTTGHVIADSISAASPYLYLVGVGADADAYTAGRLLITLTGVPV
jgi:hypothetical protein